MLLNIAFFSFVLTEFCHLREVEIFGFCNAENFFTGFT
jgi:hypothetical protein